MSALSALSAAWAPPPPHPVAGNHHATEPQGDSRHQELIGPAEQDAHVGVDAPAGQFGGEWKPVEIRAIDHLPGFRIQRHAIDLRGPAPIDFGDGPGPVAGNRWADFHVAAVDTGRAGQGQHGVKLGRVGGEADRWQGWRVVMVVLRNWWGYLVQ